MAKRRGARSEIVVVRSRANRRDTRFGVLPRSSLSILLTLPTLTDSKTVAESEGKCAERSEGNLAEGEPEGREAVARGRGSFAAASLPSSGPASVRDPWPSAGKINRPNGENCRGQASYPRQFTGSAAVRCPSAAKLPLRGSNENLIVAS